MFNQNYNGLLKIGDKLLFVMNQIYFLMKLNNNIYIYWQISNRFIRYFDILIGLMGGFMEDVEFEEMTTVLKKIRNLKKVIKK